MIRIIGIFILFIIGTAIFGFWYGKTQYQPVSPSVLSQKQPNSEADWSNWQECVNKEKEFTIKYPPEWATALEGREACRYFASGEQANISPRLVTIDFDLNATSLANLKNNVTKSDEEQVLLDTTQVEIAGQMFERVETEATGVGSRAKGLRTIYYFLTASNPIVIYYSENDVLSRQTTLPLFEAMVKSFRPVAD